MPCKCCGNDCRCTAECGSTKPCGAECNCSCKQESGKCCCQTGTCKK
ncbi:hypothetical protein CpipJ_CPIJ007722 [Culex quinquefasciatus]|uniref:Metallothionein n=1 Tax=Culex quinquefasciatus TaxID=7176 RepID=B0WN99_CULQU|nr:hypothetical protein CpipJ_CPIJ007722 [Culex quinquefasciatus]|eukprot:XP_001850183.1 hypothetical protein CpipJ_CPIJ007722 [Culex quinquefasciatus]